MVFCFFRHSQANVGILDVLFPAIPLPQHTVSDCFPAIFMIFQQKLKNGGFLAGLFPWIPRVFTKIYVKTSSIG